MEFDGLQQLNNAAGGDNPRSGSGWAVFARNIARLSSRHGSA